MTNIKKELVFVVSIHPVIHTSIHQNRKAIFVGAIAQLAERLHRIQEAGGATPPSSIFVDFLD